MPIRAQYYKRPVFAGPELNFDSASPNLPDIIARTAGKYWIYALVLLAPFIAWLPVLGSGWVSDDFFYHATFTYTLRDFIEKLSLIHAGELQFPFIRPMVIASFKIDYWIWGDDPVGFHLTNIFIHSVNCLLLYFTTRYLGLSRFASAATSIFYGLYPTHPEAVAWISGRFDLLAMFFVLASLIAWCKSRFSGNERWLVVSLAAFLFALMSKENSAALLFALPLIDWIISIRTRREWGTGTSCNWPWYIVFFALVMIILALRFWLYRDLGGYSNEQNDSMYLSGGLMKIWDNLVRGDLWILITPVSRILWPDFGTTWRMLISAAGISLAVGLIWSAVWAVRVFLKTASLPMAQIVLGISWIIIMLLPVIPIEGVKGSLDYSRFLYLPASGLAIWVGAMCDIAWRNNKITQWLLIAVLLLTLISSMFLLRQHNQTWLDAGKIAGRINAVMQTYTYGIPDNTVIYAYNFPMLWKGAHCAPIYYGGYVEFLYDIKGVDTQMIRIEPDEAAVHWANQSANARKPGIGFLWDSETESARYLGFFTPVQLSLEALEEFLRNDPSLPVLDIEPLDDYVVLPGENTNSDPEQ